MKIQYLFGNRGNWYDRNPIWKQWYWGQLVPSTDPETGVNPYTVPAGRIALITGVHLSVEVVTIATDSFMAYWAIHKTAIPADEVLFTISCSVNTAGIYRATEHGCQIMLPATTEIHGNAVTLGTNAEAWYEGYLNIMEIDA